MRRPVSIAGGMSQSEAASNQKHDKKAPTAPPTARPKARPEKETAIVSERHAASLENKPMRRHTRDAGNKEKNFAGWKKTKKTGSETTGKTTESFEARGTKWEDGRRADG